MKRPPSLEVRLAKLLAEESYRGLAARLGVSHSILWKAAAGKPIRAKSRRLIESALAELGEVHLQSSFEEFQRRMAIDLGPRRAAQVTLQVKEVIRLAYEKRGPTASLR